MWANTKPTLKQVTTSEINLSQKQCIRQTLKRCFCNLRNINNNLLMLFFKISCRMSVKARTRSPPSWWSSWEWVLCQLKRLRGWRRRVIFINRPRGINLELPRIIIMKAKSSDIIGLICSISAMLCSWERKKFRRIIWAWVKYPNSTIWKMNSSSTRTASSITALTPTKEVPLQQIDKACPCWPQIYQLPYPNLASLSARTTISQKTASPKLCCSRLFRTFAFLLSSDS